MAVSLSQTQLQGRATDESTSRIRLPTIQIHGTRRIVKSQQIWSADINLGALTGKFKPVVLDRLLSLYQQLGRDMRQLFQDYRAEASALYAKRQSTPLGASSDPKEGPTSILFDIRANVALVRLALQAENVPTALLFEAISIQGNASNRWAKNEALDWHVQARHLGLSLGQLNSGPLSEKIEPTGRYRSAYMQLDVDISEIPGDIVNTSQLNITLSKVHTVMQMSALAEIGDLASSWSTDLHVMKEKRADEVAEVKQQTSKILKRIEASERGIQPELSWFASRTVNVNITGFGVAVPLGREMAIDIRPPSSVPAMLFSIRSISFQNRRNETARFHLHTMMLQFCGQFDQNEPAHFTGDYHPSDNKMVVPQIDAEAQMSSEPQIWTLSAHSCANDFKLTLAPSIIESVFKLVDMYRLGREHVASLEKHYRSENTTQGEVDMKGITEAAAIRQRIICRMSFEFQSGTVELRRVVAGDPKERRGSHVETDTIILPRITAWLDYAGPHGGQDGSAIINVVSLLLKLSSSANTQAIHGSQNDLRPSILPFFVDIAKLVEIRAKEKSKSKMDKRPSIGHDPAPHAPSLSSAKAKAVTRVSATLRIDQSKLRLFEPESRAYVDIEWLSGGFFAKMAIGTDENMTFAGTVTGVTTELSNANAPENACIRATARDMVASVVYAPKWRDDHAGVSIVFDTKVSAHFALDQLNSWLTFMAVWGDNAPSMTPPIAAALVDPNAPHVPVHRHLEKRSMGLAIVARIQAIEFDANAGITQAKLTIQPIVLQTISDGYRTKIDVRIGETKVAATGQISGLVRSEYLHFAFDRRSSRAVRQTDPELLNMSIHAGQLSGNLFMMNRKGQAIPSNVARFHLAPSVVRLYDDWKDIQGLPKLTFSVDAGKLALVVRLQAIPELLKEFYGVLGIVTAQHESASRRSEAFKRRKTRQKEGPSSIVVALKQTMEQVGHGTDEEDFAQVMDFRLAGIELGVFNQRNDVQDIYRFHLGVLATRLSRTVKRDRATGKGYPVRDVHLSLASLSWKSAEMRQFKESDETPDMDAKSVLARIAGLKKREVVMLPQAVRLFGLPLASLCAFRYRRVRMTDRIAI